MTDKAYKSVDETTPHIMIAINRAEYEKLFGEPYPEPTDDPYIGVWMTKNDLRRGIKRWETLGYPTALQHEDKQAVVAAHHEIKKDLSREQDITENLRKENAEANEQVKTDAKNASVEVEAMRDQMFAANKNLAIEKTALKEARDALNNTSKNMLEAQRERDDYFNRLKNLRALADERIARISNLNLLQRIMRKVFRLP